MANVLVYPQSCTKAMKVWTPKTTVANHGVLLYTSVANHGILLYTSVTYYGVLLYTCTGISVTMLKVAESVHKLSGAHVDVNIRHLTTNKIMDKIFLWGICT